MTVAVTEGEIRIVASDASGTRRDVAVGSYRTEMLDSTSVSATDMRTWLYIPASQATLEEDDILAVEIKGDTAGSFDSASVWRVPVRIQNKKTGSVRETYLTVTDFKNAGAAVTTTDILYGTAFTQVATYTVNAQERLRIGHTNAVNSRLYMSLVVG